ncbi:MAG: 5-methyltetrahydrofolate--homocysteine methyltransferase [Lachnospiraceae bacterium]|nr:5-methyltetrahydrofolate--homocysteine methyltransferase [Lachnospiraceae bacterium]
MNKIEFLNLCRSKRVYLDGAMGSNLIKRGMPVGCCPEEWILEHKDVVVQLQREYVDAGTNILYAPTFTANAIKLAEYGLADRHDEINKGLMAVSKEAAGDRAYVAADLTMTGKQLKPIGPLDFEELVDVYKKQILACIEGGADLVVVETMLSLQETRAAVIAAKEVCDLPIMATLSFDNDGKTMFGTDAKTAAVTLSALGVSAVGTNCSAGPDMLLPIIRAMVSVTDIPIIAKPNAGLPVLDPDGNAVYDMDPDTFACETAKLAEAGAAILGGCCGTDPEYIGKLVEATKDIPLPPAKEIRKRFLTSERQTLSFDLNDRFIVVGERINPTGKKKLQEAFRAGDLDMAIRFAEEQEEAGAKILDINVGMSGIDEKELMLRTMEEVMQVSKLPLSLDSSYIDVLESALRRYPGRALVNSVSYEHEKIERLLPVIKKYGAMFILLPVSEEGLPKSLEEKIGTIEKILERAYALGFTKQDIVVDGLVATVGANAAAGTETIETIRYCRENGLATICGLSNISFGLPERKYVNTAFLCMAMQAGLTMAIANPGQDLLMNCMAAVDLLLNKKDAGDAYLKRIERFKELHPEGDIIVPSSSAAPKPVKSDDNGDSKSEIHTAILKGKKKAIKELVEKELRSGRSPKAILDEELMPAITEVGDLYDKGIFFLPQLIGGAETMKLAIEVIEPLLLSSDQSRKLPTIVIATVKGDVHDIGKNLVALMLKNFGFDIIDLGKDVPREVIVQTAIERNASVIALSALMTTTMQEMRHVIEYAKEKGVTAKVIIGGAVITQEYADEIGADGYATDAADAVRVAKNLLGIE